MSLECAECEHDLRGGHGPGCSRYVVPTLWIHDVDEEGFFEPPRQASRDEILASALADHPLTLAALQAGAEERKPDYEAATKALFLFGEGTEEGYKRLCAHMRTPEPDPTRRSVLRRHQSKAQQIIEAALGRQAVVLVPRSE